MRDGEQSKPFTPEDKIKVGMVVRMRVLHSEAPIPMPDTMPFGDMVVLGVIDRTVRDRIPNKGPSIEIKIGRPYMYASGLASAVGVLSRLEPSLHLSTFLSAFSARFQLAPS